MGSPTIMMQKWLHYTANISKPSSYVNLYCCVNGKMMATTTGASDTGCCAVS